MGRVPYWSHCYKYWIVYKFRFRREISTKFKNVTWHALPPKSPSVDWTAQCITTPSEFLQTTHQPPTYSSPISSPLLLIPPLNRCPSMYALHLKGSEQSVTLTPAAPSDSRTVRWKTSDRLTGWLFRCQILLLTVLISLQKCNWAKVQGGWSFQFQCCSRSEEQR